MIIVGLLAVLMVGTSLVTATGPATAATGTDQLAWGPCPAGTLTAAESQLPAAVLLQCAALTAPLDYRHPAGGIITLEVSRVASADPAARGVCCCSTRAVPAVPDSTCRCSSPAWPRSPCSTPTT